MRPNCAGCGQTPGRRLVAAGPEKIPGVELQAGGKIMLRHIRFEWLAQRGQIKPTATDMRMGERDLDGQATFRGADVDQRFVVLPRKLRRDRLGGQQAPRRHGFDKASELPGITVSGGKVACSRCPNLRRSGPQRFRQRIPETEAGRAVLLE